MWLKNLLKTKGGNSCTEKKASTKIKFRYFLNEFFYAIFRSIILFVSVFTGAKIKFFNIFLTYDL